MRKLSVVLSLGLVAMVVPAASASHPTQICLDLDPEHSQAISNDDIVDSVWAYPGATDDDHPSRYEGCGTERTGEDQDWGGANIDFEVTGVRDPDDSDSPESPDMTCTVQPGSGGCSIDPPASGGGAQAIRGWIDHDSVDHTVEADVSEGVDESAQPGASEPDTTDVVSIEWTHRDPPPSPCGDDAECWGRVTIEYQARDHQFLGKIRRESGACDTGVVTLWKKRPGRDHNVADALSSDRYWEVVFDHAVKGRFYAKLSKTQTTTFYSDWPRYPCEGDRSPVLRLN
jgi:hypothetical protein